jgi:hypothetical protein
MFSKKPGLLRTVSQLATTSNTGRTLLQSARLALTKRGYHNLAPYAIKNSADLQNLNQHNLLLEWEKHKNNIQSAINHFTNKTKPNNSTFFICQTNEFSYGTGQNPIHKDLADDIIDNAIMFAKQQNLDGLIGIGTLAFYTDEKDSQGRNYAYNMGVWTHMGTGDVIKIFKQKPSIIDGWDKKIFKVIEQTEVDPNRLQIFTGPNNESFAVLLQICLDHSQKLGADLIPKEILTMVVVPAYLMEPHYQGKPTTILLADGGIKVQDNDRGDEEKIPAENIITAYNERGKIINPSRSKDNSQTSIMGWLWEELKKMIVSNNIITLKPIPGNPNVFVGPYIKLTGDKPLPISKEQSLFPDLGTELNYALSSEPVLLNGMKVIFDQPASVYPVSLQPKEK